MEDETPSFAKVLSDVFIDEHAPSPVAKPVPTLKDKLAEVIREAPTMDDVIKNPWMHDVFVRKVKALVE